MMTIPRTEPDPVAQDSETIADVTELADQVEVRLAHDHELDELVALRWHWVRSSMRAGEELPSLDAYVAAGVDWARAHRDSHIAFAAVSSGRAVGMAWLALVARVPAPLRMDRLSGDVQSCFVLPEFRGRAVGSRLVRAVLAEARARGCEHVTVHASTQSVPMYERVGFEHSPDLLWSAVESL